MAQALAQPGASLGFDEYMRLALLDPEHGYYCRPDLKIGPGGDFVTAPEVSPLFARCMAREIALAATSLGSYELVEIGPGTGRLAVELWRALAELDAAPGSYVLIEASSRLRTVQQELIAKAGIAGSFDWQDNLPDSAARRVIIGNEILDALPVKRFSMAAGAPMERRVVLGADGLDWHDAAAGPELLDAVKHVLALLPQPLPDGYASEINLELPSLHARLAGAMSAGLILWVDYGFSRRDYYHPERRDGTAMAHIGHRAFSDPLRDPGRADVGSFVDFSAVAEAGTAADLRVAYYTTQAQFLLGCGLTEQLLPADADPGERLEENAAVNMLCSPNEMGERFKVLAMAKGLDLDWHGAGMRDLAATL